MDSSTELDRSNPTFEGQVPFRVSLGEREGREAFLTLRVLAGARVRGAPFPPGAPPPSPPPPL